MYWENPPGAVKPAYLELCLQSIDRWRDGLELRILDERSVSAVLPNIRPEVEDLVLAQKADYYRSRLLHKYGGLWLDADVIAMQPLTRLLKSLDEHSTCLYGRGDSDLSVNCFAARPQSALLAEWMARQDDVIDSATDIPWNALGKTALLKAAAGFDYARIPVERIAPLPWWKWKLLLSRWRSPRPYLRSDPIVFMLYNKFLCDAFGAATAEEIFSDRMLISKLFRHSLEDSRCA